MFFFQTDIKLYLASVIFVQSTQKKMRSMSFLNEGEVGKERKKHLLLFQGRDIFRVLCGAKRLNWNGGRSLIYLVGTAALFLGSCYLIFPFIMIMKNNWLFEEYPLFPI